MNPCPFDSNLPESSASTSRRETPQRQEQRAKLAQLAREIRTIETSGRHAGTPSVEGGQPVFSSGSPTLDACLPSGGYPAGCIVEYLRTVAGCGASYLAFAAAASAVRENSGFLVVIDTQQQVYPAALSNQGIDLSRVVFVRPESMADAIWATDQALRTSAVSAVVAELPQIDDRSARRLQLAAERGGGVGLFLRPVSARRGPSWAEIQWVVRPANNPQHPPRRTAVRRTSQSAKGSAERFASRPVTSESRPVRRISQSVDSLLEQPVESFTPRSAVAESRDLHVRLARVRGGQAGASVALRIDAATGSIRSLSSTRERHESQPQAAPTGAVHLASELARTKGPGRRAAAG